MNRVALLVFTLGPIYAISGCCPHQGSLPPVDFIAVREAQLRSDRYPLPLTAEAKTELLMYLAAGGDEAGLDEGTVVTLVYPDAEQRWGGLLATLQNPANLDAKDLTDGTYSKWFHDTPVRQVIDATAERPNLGCPPYAVRQDRFVWIFECGAKGKLSQVMVQIAVAKPEEK